MQRLIIGAFLVAALAVGSGTPLGAQALEEGVWEGSITQLDGAVEQVMFAVEQADGNMAITMHEDGGEVPFDDVRVEDGSLLFSWKTGDVVISCSLAPLAAGGYAGDCQQPGGVIMVRMTMAPSGS